MDIVTLGAALNGSAEYVNSHFRGGSNIQIVDNPDGTQTINASGEVSSEDTVARADIAAIKDGENIDSFADVETALGSKQDTISDLSTIRSGAALGATAVQPETGKGLSTNDYTTTEKTKLAGIAEGAEVNVQSNWTQTTSTADDYIKNKPTLGTAAALDVAASGNASTSQVVKGNDTRLSDARNAADVSAWAKAANKPSYNGSEIALTGYTEAQSKSSVAATDTSNTAIGKLEYRVETNENNISTDRAALVELVDGGAKNILQIGTPVTAEKNGVTAVSNKNGSITISGVSTSENQFVIVNDLYSGSTSSTYGSQIPIGSGSYVVKATGVEGVRIQAINYNTSTDTTTISTSDDDVEFTATKSYIVFRLVVMGNADFRTPATIYPMCCDGALYAVSKVYQPYRPPYQELYERVVALEQANQ